MTQANIIPAGLLHLKCVRICAAFLNCWLMPEPTKRTTASNRKRYACSRFCDIIEIWRKTCRLRLVHLQAPKNPIFYRLPAKKYPRLAFHESRIFWGCFLQPRLVYILVRLKSIMNLAYLPPHNNRAAEKYLNFFRIRNRQAVRKVAVPKALSCWLWKRVMKDAKCKAQT